MSLELALVPWETEQEKDVKGAFDSPSWQFWLLLSNSRIIFSLLGERNYSMIFL